MNKKRFGKKQWVLAVMVMLLGAAVYLNYYVAEQAPPAVGAGTDVTQTTTTATRALGESQFVNNTTAAASDYYATVRQEREQAREEALAILKDALQDVKLDDETQRETLEEVALVAMAVEQENAVESLVKAKGYADCVAFIEGDHCHVTVKTDSLTEAQTLQIAQIVMTQTDVPAANINIMAVE